ncbi:MAG: carotenoid biosynthesis protein [Synergistaceae bacterium]|nr:carotenoid biosynthesis protein [Synergistaceae bacterium]
MDRITGRGRVLAFLLGLVFLLALTDRVVFIATGFMLSDDGRYFLLLFYAPLALLFLHAFWSLGRRGVLLLLLAGLVGAGGEMAALRWGAFGVRYVYHLDVPGDAVAVGGFPLLVSLYWMAFIYVGSSLVTAIAEGSRRPVSPLTLALLDGLAVTAIDAAMDPIQVAIGSWSWHGGGPWFAVPLENFLGWFLTAFVVTLPFRLFGGLRPLPDGLPPWARYVPVSIYAILFAAFAVSLWFLDIRGPLLALFLGMGPFLLLALAALRD